MWPVLFIWLILSAFNSYRGLKQTTNSSKSHNIVDLTCPLFQFSWPLNFKNTCLEIQAWNRKCKFLDSIRTKIRSWLIQLNSLAIMKRFYIINQRKNTVLIKVIHKLLKFKLFVLQSDKKRCITVAKLN